MKCWLICFMSWVIIIFGVSPVRAQTTTTRLGEPFVEIITTDINFPTISLGIRAQMSDYNILPDLTKEQIQIDERHDPYSVSLTTRDNSLATVFVLDTNDPNGIEEELYRQILNKYMRDVHRTGDRVFVIGLTGERDYDLNQFSDMNALFNAFMQGTFEVSNFTNANILTDKLNLAISRLSADIPVGSKAQIIYVHSYVGTDNQRQVTFSHQRIPLYVIQARYYTREDGLTNLATAGTIDLTVDDINDVPTVIQNQLSGLMSQLQQNRKLYSLSYKSRQPGVGERLITIRLGDMQTSFTYIHDVVAPVVGVSNQFGQTNPNDLVIQREFIESTNTYNNPSEPLLISVTYPDNVIREELRLELFVDGISESGQISPIANNINQYQVEWDLSGYITPTETIHHVQVMIWDEYGFNISSSTLDYTIIVEAPPPGIVITQKESVDVCLDSSASDYLSLRCFFARYSAWVAGSIGLLVVVVAILGVSAGKYRRMAFSGMKNTLERGRQTVLEILGRGSEIDTNENKSTVIDDNQPPISGTEPDYGEQTMSSYGKLNVIGVAGVEEISIDRKSVVLGREVAQVTYVLPHPKISGRHIEINYHFDTQTFTVTDLESRNGTYLKSGDEQEIQLIPKRPYPLKNGDVLRLTNYQQPIKLQFSTHIHPKQSQTEIDTDSTTPNKPSSDEGGHKKLFTPPPDDIFPPTKPT
mgnify:CR=1 FL=1